MNTSLQLLAESLGWTLLHFCWQAAAIALVYRVADLGLPEARSQARYLVSLAAILAMFAASLTTLGYEIERIQNQTQNQAQNQTVPAFSLSLAHLFASRPVAEPSFAAGALRAAAPQNAGLDLSALLSWLDAAWLLGVLGLSARTAGGWWWIQRLRRRALAEAPASVLAGFSRAGERLGIRRRVDLRISRQIAGPMAIGVLRSLILLPAGALLALSPEQMEAVLAHELAHVRRADYFWNLIQTMIETLFFFHPAVWWIGGRVREQRELCCDDIAVGLCPDPLVYATALLSMEEQRTRKLDLAMALNGRRPWSGLRVRIARIVGEAPPERGRGLTPLPLAAFCAGLAILLLPAMQVFASLGGSLRGTLGGSLRPAQAQTQLRAAAPAQPPPAPIPPTVDLPQVAPPQVAPQPAAHSDPEPAQLSPSRKDAEIPAPPATGSDYIDQMRAAGYDLPAEKYINLKILGVTPEYAREMQKLGLGKPSLGELMAMKVQGITPQYVEGLRAAGFEPHSLREIVSYKIFNVSPEYLAAMKAAGFASLSAPELVQLRSQGVAPAYAAEMKKQFPNLTTRELIQLRIFKIDGAFIANARRHNFDPLTVRTLVRLRISGILNDSVSDSDHRN